MSLPEPPVMDVPFEYEPTPAIVTSPVDPDASTVLVTSSISVNTVLPLALTVSVKAEVVTSASIVLLPLEEIVKPSIPAIVI